MNRILYFVVFLLCLLSALAGLTAGINLNPQSTVKFVPLWGSAGDWVAGLGALLAVVVALLQSSKQQEKERAKVKINNEYDSDFWSLRAMSEGLVPVTVLGVYLEYDDYKRSIDLVKRPASGLSVPQKLERGESLSLIDVSGTAFWYFGQFLARQIVSEIKDRGVSSGDLQSGINELFFQELNAAGRRKARLFLKTAHEDIRYELPQSLIVNLFGEAADAEKQQREADNARLRRDIAELIEASNTDNLPPFG
ncbi:hypothetical protein ACVWXR_004042 [Pseudomonas lurida]|jgi:hypothetical protein